MYDEVEKTAGVQYGDMGGTVAMDRADFKGLRDALPIPDGEVLVGVEASGFHPMLKGHEAPFAEKSLTYLHVYTVPSDAITDGQGVPGLAGGDPIEVTRWDVDTGAIDYGMPTDAFGLLLQGSKRLNLKLWARGLTGDDAQFTVMAVRTVEHDGTAWVVTREEP